MLRHIRNFFTNEEGATALEYGLIAALIAGVIIVAVTSLGSSVSNTFSTISSQMDAAVPSTTP
jgi:pilus assembly protein Flp/PilA